MADLCVLVSVDTHVLVASRDIVDLNARKARKRKGSSCGFCCFECCARRKEYEEWFPGTVTKARTKYKMRILYGEGRVARSLPALFLQPLAQLALSRLGGTLPEYISFLYQMMETPEQRRLARARLHSFSVQTHQLAKWSRSWPVYPLITLQRASLAILHLRYHVNACLWGRVRMLILACAGYWSSESHDVCIETIWCAWG